MNAQTFEQSVGNLIKKLNIPIEIAPDIRARVDFAFRDPDQHVIAIEVKDQNFRPSEKNLEQIAQSIKKLEEVKEFILATPLPPSDEDIARFNNEFFNSEISHRWLSGLELAKFLENLSERFPKPPRVTSSVSYSTQREPRLDVVRSDEDLGTLARLSSNQTYYQYQSFTRQFSDEAVQSIKKAVRRTSIEDYLQIGKRVNVTVVHSDIKNFSTLVRLADSNTLNDAMSRYYNLTRDLVWQYGGTLDKFIGDAVLAIFNYPHTDSEATLKAVQFSAEVIQAGKIVLQELSDSLNEVVALGTRIGVSTGEISVLNIGKGATEISFVGNTINLAARLEANSDVDGVLLDHKTKVALSKAAPHFIIGLPLQQKELSADQAKGQLAPIQAWQIPPSAIPFATVAKSTK
jgi:adenylate cyclase